MAMQINDRSKIDARVAGAFATAASAGPTSFEQLARTAARESDFRPGLAASTSSAKGLFQFVDQTWLELVKKEGASVGLERQAEKIVSDGKGGLTVADPKEKAKILALRADPLVSSVMAGRFTAANTRSLSASLGRTPSDGEVYAAHVLGAAGATKLVRLAETEPTATAAVAFPRAAAANPSLFYGKDGKPRSAAELLAGLTGTPANAAARIADAHAAVAADTAPKIDPTTLATLVRAQASAAVAKEGLGGDLDRFASARLTRTALTDKAMPGAATDVVPPTGPKLDGWRARTSHDAFSALMRSDADAPADATAATGETPIRFAAGEARPSRIGGLAGGIAYVDPNQPMRLFADPATTKAPATTTPIATRPSRLLSAAASGAPAMPLPMVESGRVVRTSRLHGLPAATAGESEPSGLVAEGAARVKTVSIAPAPAAVPTGRPLLPPMPGDTAEAAAPQVRTVAATPARAARTNRPLDLLAFRRAAGSER